VDPNVLVSAAISAAGPPRNVLLSWHAGHFEMVVSYDLLYELETVLLREKFRRYLAVSDILEYVLWIRERARFVDRPRGVANISADPDDDYLYALAFEYGADLVSGDPHLVHLGTSGPVRVFSPREFLNVLSSR
jgi:uncharacterized protein